MARFDMYFKEEVEEAPKKEEIDMEQISEVIKVQIDNALQSALENIKKEEVKENDNSVKKQQGVDEEGAISIDAESSDRNNTES